MSNTPNISTSTATATADTAEQHPMNNINITALKIIPNNWYQSFNQTNIKHVQKSVFISKVNITSGFKMEIVSIGNQYTIAVREFNNKIKKKVNHIDFECSHSANCNGKLRVFELSKADIGKIGLGASKLLYKDVQLLTAHNCEFSQKQLLTLHYMNAIRNYLCSHDNVTLNSYTGIIIYEPDNYLNAKIAIFDHLLSKNRGETNTNHQLQMYCRECNFSVNIVKRRILTVELTNINAKSSKQVSAYMFKYKNHEKLPNFEKPCANPIYIYFRKNILGYGMCEILPHLELMIAEFKWTKNYMQQKLIEFDDNIFDVIDATDMNIESSRTASTTKSDTDTDTETETETPTPQPQQQQQEEESIEMELDSVFDLL